MQKRSANVIQTTCECLPIICRPCFVDTLLDAFRFIAKHTIKHSQSLWYMNVYPTEWRRCWYGMFSETHRVMRTVFLIFSLNFFPFHLCVSSMCICVSETLIVQCHVTHKTQNIHDAQWLQLFFYIQHRLPDIFDISTWASFTRRKSIFSTLNEQNDSWKCLGYKRLPKLLMLANIILNEDS